MMYEQKQHVKDSFNVFPFLYLITLEVRQNMFKSVTGVFSRFGTRFASTMVSRLSLSSNPIFSSSNLKHNVQFINQITETTYLKESIGKFEPLNESSTTEMIMTSVLRKRRLKMKKHKLRKRRKAQRALRIKIGK